MSFYIFRHGETFESKHNLSYGENVFSSEILAEGIEAVEKLALHLKEIKTDANFTSPFKRCLQTTEIISKISSKEFAADERLGEYLEDKETFNEFSSRIKNFLKSIDKDHKSLAICSHGAVIAGLTHLLTKGDFQESNLVDFPSSGILVTIKGKKITYKNFN